MRIRRYYTEEFDAERHESTAEVEFIDLCTKCEKNGEYDVKLVEEEELIPPLMSCDICEIWIDVDFDEPLGEDDFLEQVHDDNFSDVDQIS